MALIMTSFFASLTASWYFGVEAMTAVITFWSSGAGVAGAPASATSLSTDDHVVGQIFGRDEFSRRHYYCSLDGAFQFSHVARPIVTLQTGARGGGDAFDPALASRGVFRDEVVGE